MRILNEKNEIIDTDVITRQVYYSVLSLKDYKNPDFYFETLPYIDHMECAAITLEIGPYKTIAPFHWSIMVTDGENVELIPLYEASGRNYTVFAINPISGNFLPQYLNLKTGNIYQHISLTSPPLSEKKLLVVPLDYEKTADDRKKNKGPICVIFSATKMEINRPITDIW